MIRIVEKRALFSGFLLPLLLTAWMASGQSLEPDRLYAHLDKSFYVSGETIHYKVYVFNPGEILSKIIHADLIDENGRKVAQQLLKLENHASDGSLSIPLSEPEGFYFLRIYSAWNMNFSASFNFVKPIPVYNDFIPSGEVGYVDSTSTRNPVLPLTETGSLQISVLNTEPVHTGESILLNIRNPLPGHGNRMATASMSVLDLGLCGEDYEPSIESYYKKLDNLPISMNNLNYQPEESILIEGQILELESGDPVNSKVLSVYNTRDARFSRIECSNGRFSFHLPAFTGYTDLQVINMNPFQSKVNRIVRKDLAELIPIPEVPEIEMKKSQSIRKYLYYSKLRKKINEIYGRSSNDSIHLLESSVLPFTPDRSYQMEKYQLLTNLEDFMREGVVNTSHIMEEGKRKILLYNQETKKYFMKSPWFLVDGHFVFDDSITYNIPFNELRRIDLYNTNESILKYFDPIMIQGGVVAVYTNNHPLVDYIQSQPNTLWVKGLSPEPETPLNQSPPAAATLDQKPDLDPLIYWNPWILFNEDGTIALEIPANDVSGYYLIHIEGMDASGQPFSGRKVIEVLP